MHTGHDPKATCLSLLADRCHCNAQLAAVQIVRLPQVGVESLRFHLHTTGGEVWAGRCPLAHQGLTCLRVMLECASKLDITRIPRSALKACSIFPPLATTTAFTTAGSILGNASLKLSTASWCGGTGRGGFEGAALSRDSGCVGASKVAVVLVEDANVTPESCGSSSKSSGRAVVGDSGLEIPCGVFGEVL